MKKILLFFCAMFALNAMALTYNVTVPATMVAGSSSTVAVSGTWANNRVLNVTAQANVEVVNDIDATERETLADTTYTESLYSCPARTRR